MRILHKFVICVGVVLSLIASMAKASSLRSESPVIDIIEEGMPFKIGFEFQETTKGPGLCPWALDNNLLQKKPIFHVHTQDEHRELWHLVLDTSDIEFVTPPFTCDEGDLLNRAIDSIL